MTDRLFGCAFVSENEAKNGAGINNRAATYANGNAEEREAFASLAHIFKRYGDKTVFRDFSLEIYRGEILCILGESGGGKTTLLNLLASQEEADDGEIFFPCCRGDSLNGGVPRVSYAFQDDTLLPNLTALGNLTFVGGEKEECVSLLRRAELSDRADKIPRMLSGGEKQRVSLLRAFAAPFDLLLADEPFSALDVALKERMISLFLSLWREKSQKERKTAVVVTHSVKEALKIADRVIVLKNGGIAADRCVPKEDDEKQKILRMELLSALIEED